MILKGFMPRYFSTRFGLAPKNFKNENLLILNCKNAYIWTD